MRRRILLLSSAILLVFILLIFLFGIILSGAIGRYLYGYEYETRSFTDFLNAYVPILLVISLVSGAVIGFVAGTYKRK